MVLQFRELLLRRRGKVGLEAVLQHDLFGSGLQIRLRRSGVGHELSVPEVGDYHALVHEGEGRALVRGAL